MKGKRITISVNIALVLLFVFACAPLPSSQAGEGSSSDVTESLPHKAEFVTVNYEYADDIPAFCQAALPRKSVSYVDYTKDFPEFEVLPDEACLEIAILLLRVEVVRTDNMTFVPGNGYRDDGCSISELIEQRTWHEWTYPRDGSVDARVAGCVLEKQSAITLNVELPNCERHDGYISCERAYVTMSSAVEPRTLEVKFYDDGNLSFTAGFVVDQVRSQQIETLWQIVNYGGYEDLPDSIESEKEYFLEPLR